MRELDDLAASQTKRFDSKNERNVLAELRNALLPGVVLSALLLLIAFWSPLLAQIVFLASLTAMVVALLRMVRRSESKIAAHQRHLDSMEHSLAASMSTHARQLEAMQSLLAVLPIRHPLPPMRGWAISPDFANLLISLIHEHQPTTVVEFGSGVSTLITSYCLEQRGTGRLFSVEQDGEECTKTRKSLALHGLEKWVTISHAPLTKTEIKGESFVWYDLSHAELPELIDLLVIDGPAIYDVATARYPTLPLLNEKLHAGSIILLDDAGREEEHAVCKRWVAEHPEWKAEYIEAEKGAMILRRTS